MPKTNNIRTIEKLEDRGRKVTIALLPILYTSIILRQYAYRSTIVLCKLISSLCMYATLRYVLK